MALSAGAVYATLGGRFDRAGFDQFGASMYRARGQMEDGERRMRASADRTSQSLHQMGQVAKTTALGGVVALGAAIGGSIKVAADFDKAMRNVNSIAQLNEKQFRSLSKSVLELSGKTAQAPKTLAEGMYQLVSSGFSARDSLVILKSSAIAATAGLTDTATATTAVAAVLNAYHLKAKDAAGVSDTLFQTVNRGVITFDVLAHNIGTVLPFASSLGVNLNQVGASISTLTKEGLSGELAITNLKNVMSAFLKPSKGLATAIKETGASSGEALVKAKGFQGALEAVANTTDGTKGAMAKLFPNIRALTAALDLTGKSAKTANGDVAAFKDTSGATTQVFAEQAKSAAFHWQRFKAELQQTGIVIGQAVLPVLTKGITAVANWVTGLSKSGDAAKFGHAVADGFKEAGQILGDFIGVGKSVVGVLVSIGRALDLGDASHLEAILAAIAGFKIAGVVAPLVASLASGISNLILNAASAPSLAAFFADLPISGLTAFAVAVGAVGAALVLLGGHETLESQIARDNAAAHKEQAAAIKAVGDAERAAADKGLGAKQATLDLKQAKLDLAAASKKYSHDSPQYKQALLDEQRAALAATGAQADYQKSIGAQAAANKDRIAQATRRLAQAQQILNGIDEKATHRSREYGAATTAPSNPKFLQDQALAQANLTRRTQDYVQALARANTSDLSRQRLMSSSTQITEKNAQGVSLLIQSLQGVPKTVQSKLLVQNQEALSQAGKLSQTLSNMGQHHTVVQILTTAKSAQEAVAAFRAVVAGVPSSKVVRIVHNAASATQAIQQLQGAISALQDKQITITETTIKREITQTGSAPTGHGGRVPAAAAGGRTSGPQLYMVGEGQDPVEWIIPRDRKYRGRALGLLQDAMMNLLPAAKAGAKHTGKPPTTNVAGVTVQRPGSVKTALGLPIPNKIAQAGVPFDSVKSDRDNLHSQYQQAQHAYDSAHKTYENAKYRRDQVPANDKHHNYDQSRKAAQHSLDQAKTAMDKARKQVDRLKPMVTYIDRLFAAARKTDTQAKNFQSQINLDTDYMSDADKTGNQAAYNTARTARKSQTRGLIKLLQRALSLANPNSDYARSLREQLASLGGQAAVQGTSPTGTNDSTFGGDLGDPELSGAEQNPATPGEFTAAQQGRLATINKDIALAALTDDLGDDVTAAQELVDFLNPILAAAVANPASVGGDANVADLAGQVGTARQNLASLLNPGGGSTNNNPDLQAQLTQANARADAATLGQRTSDALLQVLNGSGDIGTGAANARASVVFQSYVPPSPTEALRLANYVVGGIDHQAPRQSPRETLGV